MAMLAEPRQRKRYNLVPRGKALYEDESRFGTKMLEKMGWSKGKGLGAKEDGSRDFVRIRYKNDIQGLGFEERDDQWTQHESSFSCLLESLNDENSNSNENNKQQSPAESADDMPRVGFGFQTEPKPSSTKKSKKSKLKENISGISLEEKSKQSKARVHYKKFTKGKDLSQYSEKDLANIFGKKAVDEQKLAHEDVYQQMAKTFEHIDNEMKEDLNDPEKLNGVQTINTGLSVSDYFKLKMAALKNKTSEGIQPTEENISKEIEENSAEVIVKKKKKKTNKSSESESTNYSSLKTAQDRPLEELQAENIETEKKKKKKKRDNTNELEENEDAVSNVPELIPEKKKKPSKHGKCTSIENEIVGRNSENISKEIEENSVEVIVKKNKSSESESTDYSSLKTAQDRPLEELQAENIETEKKKKKKKRHNTIGLEENEDAVSNVPGLIPEKKKKRSKHGKCTSIENEKVEGNSENETLEKNATTKKKKKSKKPDQTEIEIINPIPLEKEAIMAKEAAKTKKSKKGEQRLKAEALEDTHMKTEKKKTKKRSADTESNNSVDVTKKIKQNDAVSDKSSTPTDLNLQDLQAKLNSFNVYRISSFCAEKFRNLNLSYFPQSTLAQIEGYSFNADVKLKIETIKTDEMRITRLWDNSLSKYAMMEKEPKQAYKKYVKETVKAKKQKQKRPSLHFKTWKRKNAFTII